MPRLSQCLPKYRKHRASGQAIVTIAGRDHYLGPHGTKASKREYDRLISEWIAADRSPSFRTPAAELTVVELLARFWPHCQRLYHGHPGEREGFKIVIATIRDLYGRTAASEFGPIQLKAVREHWIANRNYSRNYANHQTKRACRIWKWAAGEGLLPASIYEALRLVPPLKRGKTSARENEPIGPVGEDVVAATLPHLPKVLCDMVRLQLLLGCRPGEICNLTPGMIDQGQEIWTITLNQHKNAWRGKTRVIYAGPKAQEIMRPYLQRGADEPLFSPAEAAQQRAAKKHAERKTKISCGNRPGTNVVRNPKRKPGNRYNTGSYANAIRYACRKAKIESWAPNRLRHSRATEVRAKFGLEAAAAILGHAEVGVTQIYAEADCIKAIEVARKIG